MSNKWLAATAGVACAAVSVGIAELIAIATGPDSAPIIAVGSTVVDATPEPAKEFAIHLFGQYDKVALLTGIALLLVVIAAGIGLAARKAIWVGYLGLLAFGLLGAICALMRPFADVSWTLPSIVGTGFGAVALHFIFGTSRADKTALSERVAEPEASQSVSETGDDDGPTPTTPRRNIARRGVLIAFGVSGIAGAAGIGFSGSKDIESVRNGIDIPKPKSMGPSGSGLDAKGITPYMTPENDFYRVDTALVVPRVYPDDYRLTIGGHVNNPMTLSYQDILSRPLVEREITLSCVSNEVGDKLAGNARWRGVLLKDLLQEVEPQDGADQLVSKSADGWTCGTPTDVCMDGRDAMLVVGMNGKPLPLERGFPVRMIVPGLYGYVSATKWLVELKLSSFADFKPYWVERDWSAEAPIKTFSRIDTPKPLSDIKSGRHSIAGVAWAQHRGIDAVEVRVDEGDWNTAELAPVIGPDTWRQWVWKWDAKPGRHKLEVRATDHEGKKQSKKRQPPFPNGATGWHSVVVNTK